MSCDPLITLSTFDARFSARKAPFSPGIQGEYNALSARPVNLKYVFMLAFLLFIVADCHPPIHIMISDASPFMLLCHFTAINVGANL